MTTDIRGYPNPATSSPAGVCMQSQTRGTRLALNATQMGQPRASRSFAFPLTTARGYTMIEILVAITIFGIIARTASSAYTAKRLQLGAAQRQVIAQLRLARSSAISQDTHYSVSITSTTQLKVFPMTLNGTVWQASSTPSVKLTLPSVTSFSTTVVGKTFEFNSRGVVLGASAVQQVDLKDTYNATKSLQVWPSGQVNEL